MKTKISFLAFTVAMLFTVACSPFKSVTTSEREADGNRTEFVLNIEKEPQGYLEITDVKLMNSESGSSESASFKVMDARMTMTLLNLKGYENFVIIASTGNQNIQPDQAIIVYKDDPEGKEKSEKVKPLIEEHVNLRLGN